MSEPKTISPKDFKKMLDENKVEFMLDLREDDDFKSWRIEGRKDIPTINLPQTVFTGEEEKHLSKIPKDKKIITVCAHGDSSKYTAELLTSKGYVAFGLEGGMDLWSGYYETHKVSTNPGIYQIYRTAKGCISHVVISDGKAAVIDAPRHLKDIEAVLEKTGAKLVHVLETHLQADHISGGLELARKHGAKYWMNPIDTKEAKYEHDKISDGTEIKIGSCSIRAIHSPGHTPGSTSYILDGRFLFTGDIIMKVSIGRPDLGGKPEAWAELLFDTLFNKFSPLADEIIILPTHAISIREQDGEGIVSLTLGNARKRGDLYQIKTLPEFQKYVAESLPENPPRYQEIREVNLGILNPDEKKRKELEIGKNLCAMSKLK